MHRSLLVKFVALLVLLVGIAPLLYIQFREADREKRLIVNSSLRVQGRVVAESLRDTLDAFGEGSLTNLNERLRKISQESLRIKLLFRPNALEADQQFFYIASSSSLSAEYLQQERDEIYASAVLEGLADSCALNRDVSVRFNNPDGDEEILTAIVPMQLTSGCWVVLTSELVSETGMTRFLASPYWREPEVLFAAGALVIAISFMGLLFFQIWLNLRRFSNLASRISANPGHSAAFSDQNTVPELAGVAKDFDRLIHTLRRSAQAMRETAEENVHAFKAPLAVIAQSLEPLKRAIPEFDNRARRSLEIAAHSVDRLDGLISQARDIETAEADLMTAEQERIDMRALLDALRDALAAQARTQEVTLAITGATEAAIKGNTGQLETAFGNILENAISFSPRGGTVGIILDKSKSFVDVVVDDAGPGVPPALLPHIFERSASFRPTQAADAPANTEAHFGIGLWISERNISYANGILTAENKPDGGFRVTVRFPAAT
ncbi:MAG: sensor histidine kinase [Magnetospiraceae bacterium]